MHYIKHQPKVDINSKIKIIKKENFNLSKHHTISFFAIFKSIILHIFLVLCFFLTDHFFYQSKENLENFEVIEISFGTSPVPTKNEFKNKQDHEIGEAPQATKSPEKLPQLPNHIAIDTAPKNDPIVTDDALDLKSINLSKKQEGPLPPENFEKISLEEFKKRKMEEEKLVNKKIKDGVLKKDAHHPHPIGKKLNIDQIPPSPLQSETIPDSPFSKESYGELTGKVNAKSVDIYKQILLRHLKLFWTVHFGQQFSEKIDVRVLVHINPIGEVTLKKVIKPSGNQDFDQLALESITKAIPLPKPRNDITKTLILE
ncbi:MAG: TonB C-terminal domain-containing protein, partial [Silvanigrellaceae bacterium]|nr:TonB C-terminal domain-containing protein [Silvanigrellaceae bacterium]